jgi:hypothetical protein
MKRRELITLLAGTAVMWTLTARGQEPGRIYRVGFLIPSGRERAAVTAFFDELHLAGFIEGQNLTVLPDGFGTREERITELAEALVKAMPDAIVCGPELQLRALQAATGTIPLIGMTQRALASNYDFLGNVLLEQGNLDETLKVNRSAFKIWEQLAQAEPQNTEWQRDLAVSYCSPVPMR